MTETGQRGKCKGTALCCIVRETVGGAQQGEEKEGGVGDRHCHVGPVMDGGREDGKREGRRNEVHSYGNTVATSSYM